MKFQYQATNKQGAVVQGTVDGASAMAARSSLRFAGLNIQSIEPVTMGSSDASVSVSRNPLIKPLTSKSTGLFGKGFLGGKRVKYNDLVVALSQLSIMIQSGDDLAGAIRVVADQCVHPTLRQVLQSVKRDVEEGLKFSVAMSKHPKVFDVSMVAAVDAGEHSGKLIDVLERMTTLLQRDQQLKSSVLSMLTYPAVLLFITCSVVSSMFFFVLPQFAKVFKEMERPVPPLTSFLLSVGTTLQNYWFVIIGFLGVLIAAALYARRFPQWRYTIDYIILNGFGVREASRPLMAGRIFRLMGTMLENGVPLLDTVKLSQRATKNVYYRDMFRRMEKDILEGKGIGPTVAAVTFFPVGAGHMLETGERSAKIAFVLQTIGEYYEKEGEQKLRWFVKLLEPVMIMGLGGVVGTVVMSIVLPMLDITTAT
ncbi:MAG: type II secretion system F family protein [Pirellula sp.]|jgi:type II secretory pathway component PulF